MNYYVPIFKKVKYSASLNIERTLPAKGEIVVKVGDAVLPFTKIGHTKVSKESFKLDPKLSLSSKVKEGSFVYKGEKLGRLGFKKFEAPYNGTISQKGDSWLFYQEKKDNWLLSGVWGTVTEVIGNIAVRISTQTVDINFLAYSNKVLMGELIVFPNPTDLLDLEYLKNFSNNVRDKIIYVGHHIREEVYVKAVELGVGGLIAGSIDARLYSYSKSQPTAVCITTGFGKYSTQQYIFEFFKSISNRHVFLDGRNGYLRVPVPPDNKFSETPMKSSLRVVKPGLQVYLFDKQHMGLEGEVDRVQDDVIYVKLNKSNTVVETMMPNLFALN